MDRRAFMVATTALLVSPTALEAQPSGKMWRIGILRPGPSSTDMGAAKMRAALKDLGYTEGQNISITVRFAERKPERFALLAAELVQLNVDAIVTTGDRAARALRRETKTIPIVLGDDDLVSEGHVASFARPGGNVTGVSMLAPELNVKRLQILKEAVPEVQRVAVLWDPDTGSAHLSPLQKAAEAIGVQLKIFEVRGATDLAGIFQTARAWRADAVNVLASTLLNNLSATAIVEMAAKNKLPAIYQFPESTKAGGLMSYGPTLDELYRLLVKQLDRILKGAKPADLPVEQTSKVEFVINLKTAKALGLTIPPLLLLRADHVIE